MDEPTTPDASPLARIAGMRLSVAERRLVEYLLNSSDLVVGSITAQELARRSGTSRSTVDRFAKRAGYTGLRELRLALLAESRSVLPIAEASRERAADPVLTPSDRMGEVAYKVFHSAAIRAMRLAEILSRSAELPRLVEALERAGAIEVFGAGASAVVAHDMHQRLLRLGLPIRFAADHHGQIAHAALMREGDLAVAVSYSGRTRSTVEAAAVARAGGATVAAVAGVPRSPLGEAADIPLVMPPGVSLFGADAVLTRSLEMTFNEVVFHCLALRNPAMRAEVERIEALLAAERA